MDDKQKQQHGATDGEQQQGQSSPSSGDAIAPLIFRYQTEISAITGCPQGANIVPKGGYRAVHEDISDWRNFLPPAHLDPMRFGRSTGSVRCLMWALSMFESAEQLRSMVARVEKTVPKFKVKIGDHYARLELAPTDGKRTSASRDGHFSFYESLAFEPRACVREVAAI